jgi:5'-AMP-activated protein kinase catalytic alpha subunit
MESSELGSMIDNFTIENTIGRGTFGKVKIGKHVPTDETIAIKILNKTGIADTRKMTKEIHILKQLRHPHIIQTFQIFDTADKMYIVQEYAANGELSEYLAKLGKLDERNACRIFQ